MKNVNPLTLFFRLLLFTLLVLTSGLLQHSAAQDQVNIIEANRIEGGTFQGQRIQKIIGAVHLKSDDLEIFTDSAYKFVNKSEIRAFGNIQINTEEEKIWADSVVYLTDIDFSRLRGRVIIDTDSTTLFGNSVDYRFTTKVAHFLDKIRLEDQRGTLLADSGFYFRKADSAKFRGKVQLSDSLKYLEGDSLFSNRRSEYYEVYGNVFGDDRENDTMLKGDYLQADSTGKRLLEGNAWLKSFEKDTADTSQADTTHIRAVNILSQEERTPKDTSATVFANMDVRIWSPSFSAVADSSKFTDSLDTFELWKEAKAWNKNIQLSGPYIYSKLKDGEIDSLKSYPRPFIVEQDSIINRLNQITGDTLHIDFKAGALSEILVFGNAHLLRFSKNEADSSDGAIELTAPSIQILFESGEIDSLRAIGNNNGSYLPENKQTADKKLEGFVWTPELRPQRPQEKMQRRLPLISEEIFFDLPKRYIDFLQKNKPYNSRLDSVANGGSY